MSTTVSTPSKWPGRCAPSSTSPSGPASTPHHRLRRRGRSPPAAGAKTTSTPSARADLEVGLERARVAVEVLVRAELQRVHEDGGEHAIARRSCAPRISVRVALVQRAHRHHDGDAARPAQPAHAASSLAGTRDRRRSCRHRSRPSPGERRRAAPRRLRRRSTPAARARSAVSRAMREYAGNALRGASQRRRDARRPCRRRRAPPARSARRRRGAARCPAPRRAAGRASARAARPRPARSRSADCATSVTRWFAPTASAAWYSGRAVLLDPDRLARPSRRPAPRRASRSASGAVTPKQRAGQPLQVDLGAGERHHRVQRHRQRADARQRVQHVRCRAPRWCARPSCRRAARADAARPRTRSGNTSSGTATTQQRRPRRATSSGGSTGSVRARALSARRRLAARHGGNADDAMARPAAARRRARHRRGRRR